MADLTIGGVYFNEDLDAQFGGDITISNATPALNLTDTDNSSNIALSSVGGALIVNSTSDQVFQIGGSEYFRVATSLATFAGGVTVGNNLYLGDNKEIILGAASDYKIYHNSTTNVNHVSSLLDRQLSINGNIINLTNQANDSTYLLLNSTSATFSTNVVLDDASGASPQVQWINGSDDTGAMYLNSSGKLQIVTGGSLRQEISSSSTEFTGNAMPSADSTYDLGTTGNRWSTLYVDNITITNDLPGGPYLPLTGGTLSSTLNINGNGAAPLKWGNASGIGTLTYDSTPNPIIRAESGKSLIFDTNGATTALTLNSSQNAIFEGRIIANGTDVTFNPDGDSTAVIKNAGTDAIALFAGSGDTLYLGGNDTSGM